MSSRTFRRAAATLLIAALACLAAAAPAHASGPVRRSYDSPVRTESGGGFVAFLLRIFAFAGGAMDPNG